MLWCVISYSPILFLIETKQLFQNWDCFNIINWIINIIIIKMLAGKKNNVKIKPLAINAFWLCNNYVRNLMKNNLKVNA